MVTPKVNFFVKYAPSLKGLGINSKKYLKYKDKRNFYSCNNNKYNYLGYIEHGSKEKIDYLDYSGNNEKSSGLFDKDGMMDKKQIKDFKNNLRETNSVIWDALISFEEGFGFEYCNTSEQALNILNKVLPSFFKEAGLEKENITWCAGLHTNTDNRHIHITFYENKPLALNCNGKKTYSLGKLPITAINKMKILTELASKQRTDDIYLKRNQITNEFEKKIENYIRRKKMFTKFRDLAKALPKQGRTSYDSENMILHKNKIDYLAESIIKSDDSTYSSYKTFLTLLAEKDESILRMCKMSNIDFKKVTMFEKYYNDLFRRLGNILITKVKEYSMDLNFTNNQIKNRLIAKRIRKQQDEFLFNKLMNLTTQLNMEAQNYFKQHMRMLEEMSLQTLIEEGAIEM